MTEMLTCEICGYQGPYLAQDHDHATGLCRGRLCYSCNRRLAHVDQTAAWLTRAKHYLEKWAQTPSGNRYVSVDARPFSVSAETRRLSAIVGRHYAEQIVAKWQ